MAVFPGTASQHRQESNQHECQTAQDGEDDSPVNFADVLVAASSAEDVCHDENGERSSEASIRQRAKCSAEAGTVLLWCDTAIMLCKRTEPAAMMLDASLASFVIRRRLILVW